MHNFATIMIARGIIMAATMAVAMTSTAHGQSLELGDVAEGAFQAEQMGETTPLNDGESYARMSADGRQVIQYSFKTGEPTAVLFDVSSTFNGPTLSAIDGFIMSPDGTKMLVQTQTRKVYRRSATAVYYIYDIKNHYLDELSDTGGPQQSPVWSPDSKLVAFVRDNNIHLVKLLYDNAESQITRDGAAGTIINGIPDWVNEEEFAFTTAMTFTADSKMICWIKYDETAVREYSIPIYNKDRSAVDASSPTYPSSFSYKYPKAGEDNSKVSVWSYDILSKQTRKMDVPIDSDGYVPRIVSTAENDNIIVYTMNRHQDNLCLYSVNTRSTVAKLLIREDADCYVKEENMECIYLSDNYIVIPSDRSGYTQLYLYNRSNGQLVRQMTAGDYDVTDLYGFDEATGNVYYQAAGKNALNREVYMADKKGKVTCLTPADGWNSAVFSTSYAYFLRQWSDCNTPYRVTICTNKGKELACIIDNKALIDKLSAYSLPEKEFFTFTTSDGATLNGVIMRPSNGSSAQPSPLIMWQYSGPGSQQVRNSWSMGSIVQGSLYDAYLVQEGFAVACVDGRGTGGRGSKWEKCVYQKLGDIESRDQTEAAAYLGSLSYIDNDNIGIWGWSYGGFNTLMSMSTGEPIFKAGVAVAPVTDWRFYDTIYTERYMRTPRENASGYDDNPITRASRLNGRLLICHGLADDNVHTQNTFLYSESLVQADKDFSMNIYTDRNHSIYGNNARTHLLRQITQHFIDNMTK